MVRKQPSAMKSAIIHLWAYFKRYRIVSITLFDKIEDIFSHPYPSKEQTNKIIEVAGF
jgi:hypothetical protein